MTNNIYNCTVLSNGVKMPWLGLGVFRVGDGKEVESLIYAAVKAGYRSIDTAACYGNEKGIGKAVKACEIKREELFITTKVWNSDQGYDTTLKAFEESRKRLELDYLDLYLIHWAVKSKYRETWRALEKLYKEGLVRAIGVSNFQIHHLEDIIKSCEIIPMVNQVEFHPLLIQEKLHSFCKANKIQLEAWSPLMRGNLDIPVIRAIGEKHGKTPAQVILRWDLQKEVVTIPKTTHENRLIENMDIFDFTLSDEDMLKIDSLNQKKRFGQDPDNFNFDFLENKKFN